MQFALVLVQCLIVPRHMHPSLLSWTHTAMLLLLSHIHSHLCDSLMGRQWQQSVRACCSITGTVSHAVCVCAVLFCRISTAVTAGLQYTTLEACWLQGSCHSAPFSVPVGHERLHYWDGSCVITVHASVRAVTLTYGIRLWNTFHHHLTLTHTSATSH